MRLDKPYRKLSTQEVTLRREMRKIHKATLEIMKLGLRPEINENVLENLYVEIVDPENGECWTYGDNFRTS